MELQEEQDTEDMLGVLQTIDAVFSSVVDMMIFTRKHLLMLHS